jgi:uncharacterized phage protein gp47/JayE
MMAYGLDGTGFTPKTLPVVRADLQAAVQLAFGASMDVGDQSAFGQVIGIIAAEIATLWEGLEAVNSSQDPGKATGAGLDALSALTGTFRPPASYSTVVLTLFGTPTTVVPTGSQASASTDAVFQTTASATIVAAPNWAASTGYIIGNRVFHDTDKIYECIVAGTSASSGGPTGTGSDITDGSVHWKNIGASLLSNGVVDVDSRATVTGAVVAAAGDITTIITSVSGWDSVVNLADATPGRDLAQDAELRNLRELELAGAGVSPLDAILAELLTISGIESCTVFQNNTDTTNSDGMPPHSVEALVRTTWSPGADEDQQIYDALLANVAAGIVTTGTTSGTATDSQGTSYTIKFSRPTEIAIYIIINVTVDASAFPVDGADEIKTAIVEWGDAQSTGKNAVASGISAQAFQVDGVLDVTACYIGTAPSPGTSTTIAISTRQLATYDTSRITVNVTNGTP